jgi:hypothetical protein
VRTKIFRVADRVSVPAEIKKFSQKNLDDFETFWLPRIEAERQEEETYWNWVSKYRLYGSSANYESYVIECDLITQGMMLIETRNHRSRFDKNRRLVYVATIQTAPWNLPNAQPKPLFRAVGSVLLSFAKRRSLQLGYDGLVGLHSLPRAEEFYRKISMIDCGQDEEKDGLTYFEWYKIGGSP